MEKIKMWFVELLLKKYLAGWLVGIWNKATGFRTQLVILLGCLIALGDFFNLIPHDTALKFLELLGGVGAATFRPRFHALRFFHYFLSQ